MVQGCQQLPRSLSSPFHPTGLQQQQQLLEPAAEHNPHSLLQEALSRQHSSSLCQSHSTRCWHRPGSSCRHNLQGLLCWSQGLRWASCHPSLRRPQALAAAAIQHQGHL